MTPLTTLLLMLSLLAIGNTAAATCHTVPDVLEDSRPKMPIVPGGDTASKQFGLFRLSSG